MLISNNILFIFNKFISPWKNAIGFFFFFCLNFTPATFVICDALVYFIINNIVVIILGLSQMIILVRVINYFDD